MRPFPRVGLRLLQGLALVLLLLGLQLAWTPRYAFPPAEPFVGESWYNPYAEFTGRGLRANFHTHTRSWNGIAAGNGAVDMGFGVYADLGYDVVGFSNYHQITRPKHPGEVLFVPSYEHGLSATQVRLREEKLAASPV